MTALSDESLDWMVRFVTELPAAVSLFDRDGRYLAASAEWTSVFGLSSTGLVGQRHGELCPIGEATVDELLHRARSQETAEDSLTIVDAAGLPAQHLNLVARANRAPDGSVVGTLVSAQPTASGQNAVAPRALSGLAERHEFTRRLRELLAAPERERESIVVFAINLDGFRSINNLHGVAVGDQVLAVTAERLLLGTRSRQSGEGTTARPRDLVARLGADEFGIICGAPALQPAEAEALGARLSRIVRSPIAIGLQPLRLTASIGFVIPTASHGGADDLMRDLNLALQQAKSLGPNRVVAWHPDLTQSATRRYSLAEQLRQAFDNGEFLLHYQPVLRLSDNRMAGTEALLRWNNPSEGLVTSARFLPILEETGLIIDVGGWVIREAARQVEAWRVLYGRDIIDWVSVNLSGRQFGDSASLLGTLRGVYDSGFAVHRLRLEITEATLMRDPEASRAVFAQLQELGIRVAIDDFGTGYSSLNSLRDFPVDTIKIDTEFVAQIGTADGEKLALALLDIARMFGAAIVAEGVETEAQRAFLRSAGCGFGQGYLFAEPMDGALLGAFALTHAVTTPRAPAPPDAPDAAVNLPTSTGLSRAR